MFSFLLDKHCKLELLDHRVDVCLSKKKKKKPASFPKRSDHFIFPPVIHDIPIPLPGPRLALLVI